MGTMSRKVRDNSRIFRINDRLVTCVTISGFAKELGVTPHTVRRYEERGVIPLAPITYNRVRYYPLSIVRRVKPIICNFPQHTKPDSDDIAKIHLIFKEEREKYAKTTG